MNVDDIWNQPNKSPKSASSSTGSSTFGGGASFFLGYYFLSAFLLPAAGAETEAEAVTGPEAPSLP